MAEVAESLLGSGWTLRLRVTGNSMRPLIPNRSLVRIAPISDSGQLSLGDIVLTRAASGRLVAHRVVELDGERCRTKGDASGRRDGWIRHSQVLGKILGIEGALFLPLHGPIARRAGLWLNRHYPRLVRLKAAVKGRLSGSLQRLAGEGS